MNTFFCLQLKVMDYFFQKKIVIKVHMRCDKCRKKALSIAASAHGKKCYYVTLPDQYISSRH
jgi:hypothetical protein